MGAAGMSLLLLLPAAEADTVGTGAAAFSTLLLLLLLLLALLTAADKGETLPNTILRLQGLMTEWPAGLLFMFMWWCKEWRRQ